MPESAYERARRHSQASEFPYGVVEDRHGNVNPRMLSCDNCGDYKEPDQMVHTTDNEINPIGDTLCPTCHEDATEPNPEIVERRSGGYPTI